MQYVQIHTHTHIYSDHPQHCKRYVCNGRPRFMHSCINTYIHTYIQILSNGMSIMFVTENLGPCMSRYTYIYTHTDPQQQYKHYVCNRRSRSDHSSCGHLLQVHSMDVCVCVCVCVCVYMRARARVCVCVCVRVNI